MGFSNTLRSTGESLSSSQRRWAVLSVVIGTIMASLDGSIANVALPAIARDVHTSAAASIWVVNAYQLAVTATLLSFSSLGDIFGYARVYRIAMIGFVVGSLLCAMSHSLVTLALARVLQGVAASAQMAVSPAISRSLYPHAQLGRAISNNALAVALSAAAGPSVAGLVLAFASWPWLFLINVPIGLVAFALSLRYIPENPGTGHAFDMPSAIGSALTFGLFVMSIDGLGHGVNRLVSALEILAFGAIAAGFIRRQRSLAIPMFAIDLFARPIFSLSVATSYLAFIGQALTIVSLPFYFEDVLGFSAVKTGFLITPWPLAIMLVAKYAGRLADRYPAGVLTTAGMLVNAAGLTSLVLLPPHPSVLDIVWRLVIGGVGTGFFQSPNSRAIMGNAPLERSGAAGGIQAMARVTGQTTGAALVALVFGVFETGVKANHTGVTVTLVLAIALTLFAAFISSLRLRPQVERDGARQQYQPEQ